MASDIAIFVPAELDLQLPFHPVFGFRQDAEGVDCLYAALVHGLISPKQLIDKYISIVNPDRLL